MIRAVIFDLDGTLLDTRPAIEASFLHVFEQFRSAFVTDVFRFNPVEIHMCFIFVAGVFHCLNDGKIGVMKTDVLADNGDGDFFFRMQDCFCHFPPVAKINFIGLNAKLTADDGGEVLLLQHQGRFIKIIDCGVFNDAVRLDIAEKRDFRFDILRHVPVAAADDKIGPDSEVLQFPDRMLGGLGFVFAGAGNIGHQRHMQETDVRRLFDRDLSDRLNKGLGFNVTDRAADFGDCDIRVRPLADIIDEAFDFIGDMGNDLDCLTKIFPSSFPGQNIPPCLA